MDTKVAIGIILIFGGAFVAVGSISGNLGPMLAAQFDPSDLDQGTATTKAGHSQSFVGKIVSGLGGIATGVGPFLVP